jgi:phosphatidylcholine synthase
MSHVTGQPRQGTVRSGADPAGQRGGAPRQYAHGARLTVAWIAHLYTASGALLCFLATIAVFERDYRAAFLWLYLQVAVDATDGIVARALRVGERTPAFDGAKLDDMVDYLSYVFVPALIVWRAGLVPDGWAIPVCAAVLLASAFGFNRADAKTSDHFFTGFPSYWNIVVLYLFVGGTPLHLNAAVLLALAALVFVPIRYLYPSRGGGYPRLTNALGALWALALLVLLWQLPTPSPPLVLASLLFPAYYLLLSLVLEARRRAGARSAPFRPG